MAEEPAAPPQDIRVHFSSWMPAGDDPAPSRIIILPAGSSLKLLLRRLSAELDTDLVATIGGGGNAFVVINEVHCAVPQDLERILKDGDVVLLMPFIAGG
jgi:molybdopterin converting factor small subunit